MRPETAGTKTPMTIRWREDAAADTQTKGSIDRELGWFYAQRLQRSTFQPLLLSISSQFCESLQRLGDKESNFVNFSTKSQSSLMRQTRRDWQLTPVGPRTVGIYVDLNQWCYSWDATLKFSLSTVIGAATGFWLVSGAHTSQIVLTVGYKGAPKEYAQFTPRHLPKYRSAQGMLPRGYPTTGVWVTLVKWHSFSESG